MTKEPIEERLRRELARVNRWIVALKREPRPQEWEAGGDNTPLSADADAMQVGEEREIRAELLGMLLERAARLDSALARTGEGTYGVCARCERAIHRERLEALPEATYCLACEEEIESAARPAEPTEEEWVEAEEIYREKSRFE
jgi:RNA polymerase-binding transcription factor DksA